MLATKRIKEAPRKTRIDVTFTVMNVASTAGAVVLCLWFHSVSSFVAFLVMYTICGLGLTLGYHRLFAHHAFSVPKWLERFIAVCGYLAIQRGPIFWVATHRKHHLDTDEPDNDPHTPKDGLWHVHFGWIQRRRDDIWDPAIYRRLTPDLVEDPLYLWMDHESHDYLTSISLVALSFTFGGLIGGRFAGFSFYNAMCFLAWVGLLNRVALLQAFGLINSVCHLIGSRPFQTLGADNSANNLLVALIIFGEGWHNNHHAFPSAARQGLRWYQPDVAWYVIWVLKELGLASNVRLASRQAIARKAWKPEHLSGRAGGV
jgi:stearoyl-CoA desaturase (delta-9 desaturase)